MRSGSALLLGALLVTAALVGGAWWFRSAPDDVAPDAAAQRSTAPGPARETAPAGEANDEATGPGDTASRAPGPADPAVVEPEDAIPDPPADFAEHSARPGRRLRLQRSALDRSRPLTLALGLPVRHDSEEPLETRLVAPSHGLHVTQADLRGGGGHWAKIEVPPEWLDAEAFMVEVRVREKTHLPLRRYVVELR